MNNQRFKNTSSNNILANSNNGIGIKRSISGSTSSDSSIGGGLSSSFSLSSPLAMMQQQQTQQSLSSSLSNNTSNSNSSPQIGSFTQNYELYSLHKMFCINTSTSSTNNRENSIGGSTSSTSSSTIGLLKKSNSSQGKSLLSDHFGSGREDVYFNKYGVLPPNSSLQSLAPTNTSIILLAQGVGSNHSFTAMYCSNDYLIFRFVGPSKVPSYKYVKWEKDSSKRIVSMCFDPTAIFLLCLLGDTSSRIIPIYYDMGNKVVLDHNNSNSSSNSGKSSHHLHSSSQDKLSSLVNSSKLFNSQPSGSPLKGTSSSNNNNLNNSKFKIPPISKKGMTGSSCLWWKTSNNEDYAIITTTSKNIYFVGLGDTHPIHKQKFEYAIEKIEIVNTDSETFLLIATKSNGYFQLIIEQKLDHRYETIIPQIRNAEYHATLAEFPKSLFSSDRYVSDRTIISQKTSSSGVNSSNSTSFNENVVVSFLKSTSKLEIYEPSYLNKYPLFVYQLTPNTTHYYFTKHVTIIAETSNGNNSSNNNNSNNNSSSNLGNESINESRSSILVLSNIVAGTAFNSKFINNQSVMQRFQLSPGEVILGITRSATIPTDNNNGGDKLYSPTLQSQQSQQYTSLPSCFVWTNFAIYDLRQKKSPEEIFFELVSKNLEKSDGEALGKTFRMDLLSLYETAADNAFEQGQYGRALDLYYLSGVKTNKLVYKFLEIGRMDIIMTHLKAILHQPDSFNVLDRKKISDLLFQCYLQKLLSSREEFKFFDAEFSNFLSTNQDYAVIPALKLLSSNGLLDYFLSVAHSRKVMGPALNMLIESDILHLDQQNISFLQNGYTLELKSHANGMIFDCLPPKIQVKLIIEDLQNIPRYMRRLYHILPLLDEKDLLDIAEIFDPDVFIPPVQSNSGSGITPGGPNNGNNSGNNSNNQSPTSTGNNGSNIPMNSSYSNIMILQDPESIFENSLLPGRQSESIFIKPEEYFEFYIMVLLCLIYKKNNRPNEQAGGQEDQQIEQDVKQDVKQEQQIEQQPPQEMEKEKEKEKEQINDSNNKNKIDPDLMKLVMPTLQKNEKRAVKVSCGWDHVAVLTKEGEVFTWGNNTSGQLGHGLEIGRCQLTPKKIDFFNSIKASIVLVECGGEHTIAVDANHQVYSWGSDKYGQLGLGTKSVALTRPKIIENLSGQKIQCIAAGYAHTLVLKKSGDLYSFGYGELGQLGTGQYKSNSVPTRIETSGIIKMLHGGRITQVAAGYGHSVMCSDNGEVFSWGLGKYGQLGHGTMENICRPKLVENLLGVTKISCGHFHTVATTDLKNVYSWGQGDHMKLGHGSDKGEYSPRVVDFFFHKNVSKIVCGLNHTVTLTYPDDLNNNSVENSDEDESSPIYIWGGGEHGKLGLGGDLKSPFFDKPIPTQIPNINSLNIIDIACGSDFTAIVTQNGAVYVWGYGRLGQIGNGKNEDSWIPIRIPLHLDSKSSMLLLQSDNDKNIRFSQEGLEEVLCSHANQYRIQKVISMAKQFENWDIVSTLYGIIDEPISTLESKLLHIQQKNYDTSKHVSTLIQLLYNYFIKDSLLNSSLVEEDKEKKVVVDQQEQQDTNIIYTPPMISTTAGSIDSNSSSPKLKSNEEREKDKKDLEKKERDKSKLVLIHSKLLVLIFNYWKSKELPIQELESYLLNNMNSFSLLLCNILEINSNQEFPLILDFSPSFYLLTLKNYLQYLKTQSEIEKNNQKVSEKILWTNIKENLEKDILQRSKIEIQALIGTSSILGGPSIGGSVNHGSGDIAFTCNHFFSKRQYYGSILPDFQAEIQKLSIPSSSTLKLLLLEYNKKSISQACPLCLCNTLKDLQNDESKKDLLKLFNP
ncbi:hypothetical protein CYY_008433 [Polysphondylium violaceum]|uniref:RCC1-like domain-containing protein n=1 Tax=Polysphondylium violaceum TaxID=133409 RepID=A0A8J4PND7_9MYCE|nr:hypothetical protein CYY_008433 [Polysphondylium violaceum]